MIAHSHKNLHMNIAKNVISQSCSTNTPSLHMGTYIGALLICAKGVVHFIEDDSQRVNVHFLVIICAFLLLLPIGRREKPCTLDISAYLAVLHIATCTTLITCSGLMYSKVPMLRVLSLLL